MASGNRVRPHNPWRLLVLLVFVLAGFLFVTSAVTADGSDLRPAGGTLTSLLRDSAADFEDDRALLTELNQEIQALSRSSSGTHTDDLRKKAEALESPTGFSEVTGAGIRIVLDDAPRELGVPGLDPNALVVHEQDLQAFVNALWSGNARAVTLQGQRIIATTGIKCVGSTVVLDGVPYAPPYRIEAVGDPELLRATLETNPAVKLYERYSDQFGLGLKIERVDTVTAPAYGGTVSLGHARPPE